RDSRLATFPASGGHHRWYQGDWQSDKPFNPDEIRLPDPDPHSDPAYQFLAPISNHLPKYLPDRTLLTSDPVWRGRGIGLYVGAGFMNPSIDSFAQSVKNGTSGGSDPD